MRRSIAWLIAAAVSAIAGAALAADPPLRVVTTTADLKTLVQAVGGDQVAVESVVNPGSDPRTFEPNASQILRLKGAQLVVRGGGDVEPWLAKSSVKAPVVDVARDAKAGGAPQRLDAPSASPVTAAIAAELAKMRPSASDVFAANRRKFLERLEAGRPR